MIRSVDIAISLLSTLLVSSTDGVPTRSDDRRSQYPITMRLINTGTLSFEEFIGENIPTYAILSHTLGNDEESFKGFQDPSCAHKEGYQKIWMTCKQAREDGIQYAWIDTCCIDKSSSAELSEAINSMYHCYQRSKLCYAYLSGLPAAATP